MKPTIGRIVIYRLADHDKETLRARGASNPNNGADEAPAVVVRAWSDTCVNLQVLLDGEGTLWLGSVQLADAPDQPRRWRWPERG